MPSDSSILREQERAMLDKIRVAEPSMVERAATPDPEIIMGLIGVTYLPTGRPKGYIRLYPHDFIVEEVTQEGEVVHLASDAPFKGSDDQRTLWADLVKANIPSPHAMADLAQALGIEQQRLTYAGIKDSFAVTAQRVSLRGVTKEAAEAVRHPNVQLRPVAYGSGMLQPGSLQGNRFTILVRTDGDATPHLERLSKTGAYNFFGAQRFGSRLLSHKLGQALLQGDVDGALRMYFGRPGPFDVQLFREVREVMWHAFGDWDKMLGFARRLPYTFRDEIRVLEALRQDPRKTRAALTIIKEQVRLWIYAYGSWVMNRHLSNLVSTGKPVPETLNIPLAGESPLPEHRAMMEKDGTADFARALGMYPYVQIARKDIPARIRFKGLTWTNVPQGHVLRFMLDRGSYATSFLSHALSLHEGLPVPEWVKDGDIDTFKTLGDGDLDAIRDRFGDALTRRDAFVAKEGGEDGQE
jgi:tRNA pseudouridine13 synthase